MKVLVTGGDGFIGRHVCEGLLREGADVVVVDDNSNSAPSGLPVERVSESVLCEEEMRAAMDGCDAVVHLAALTSAPSSMDDPSRYAMVNRVGFTVIASEAARVGARLVYASSAAVYGGRGGVKDESDPRLPESIYAVDKTANEMDALVLQSKGLSHLGLRLFNVYGPGQNAGGYAGVITRWIDLAATGKPITVFGTGEQTRDFVHVSDVADAFCRAVRSDFVGVLNVGTGSRISIRRLAEMFCSISGSQVAYGPRRLGDPHDSLASVEAVSNRLGWKPETDFTQGLQDMWRSHGRD